MKSKTGLIAVILMAMCVMVGFSPVLAADYLADFRDSSTVTDPNATPSLLPAAAQDSITASQRQIDVSVLMPDGTTANYQGNGFVVHEDGWIVSTTGFLNGVNILAHPDDILFQTSPIYPLGFFEESGLAVFKAMDVPEDRALFTAMKQGFVRKVEFAAETSSGATVYAHRDGYSVRGTSAFIYTKTPFRAHVLGVVSKLDIRFGEPEGKYILIDRQIPSFLIGAMVVDERGRVVGMAYANDGEYGMLLSAQTIQEKFGEFLVSYVNYTAAGGITLEEKFGIGRQKNLIDEITVLIAVNALERPKNLARCVTEMLVMTRSGECRDRFSHYEPRVVAEAMGEDIRGELGGVGMELTMRDGYVTVVALIDGTPASRANVKAGDVISAVNGVDVRDVKTAVKLIRGAPGTEVEVTILRKGAKVPMKVKLIREKITVQSVRAATTPDVPPIGILTTTVFNENTPELFGAELQKFVDQGINRVALDFRNDPGGLLNSAFRMLAYFMKPDDTAIVMKERSQETVYDVNRLVKEKKIKKENVGAFRNLKVVILVNEGSASASEIFSGTMKDYGYTVVGKPTFQKGVGQSVFPLSDGSTLSLTTFEFLVGNNHVVIRDKGVTPTVIVENPEDKSKDLQLEEALRILKGTDVSPSSINF